MSSLKKNFIYNIIYQILILIVPLISSPYLSRVIGSDGIGIYSYTYSIVYYFMLLTLLGVNNYGNRSIAQIRDNKLEMKKTFWSIFAVQLIMGLAMLIIYSLIIIFNNNYQIYFLIESIFIISSILDINWFFFGIEDFKSTIMRNSIVKIGSLVLIFLFVKSRNDLWKYVFIMAIVTLISQLMMWKLLFKKIDFYIPKLDEIKKHIKPNIILFIPIIAVSIYKIMDKIMLGVLTAVNEVGYYESAEKIISVPVAIVSSLGTVMLPRISNLLAANKKDKVEKYLCDSINFIMFLAYPICFGLATIGKTFAPLFFGESFLKTGILIVYLAFTLPILAFANVVRTQYLIPFGKDTIFLKSSFCGAIVNLIVNFLLIPKYASIGACIGTIFAEFFVMIYQCIKIRTEVPIYKYFLITTKFLISSIVMYLIINIFNLFKISKLMIMLMQILFGIIIYSILNIKYILQILKNKL